ncbi:MAG UNVERIFIED_CONTAM: hypothetical protein LVR29_02045 [Microcystis novacekii LVE1205-3]
MMKIPKPNLLVSLLKKAGHDVITANEAGLARKVDSLSLRLHQKGKSSAVNPQL